MATKSLSSSSQSSSSTASSSVSSSRKRRAPPETDVSSLVREYHYCGMYQPMSMVADNAEENRYVPTAAFHFHLRIVWDDAQERSGEVQGDVYWKYGLFWAQVRAVQTDEQLFWPVARQSEAVVGRVQRRIETRGVRRESEHQSRGSHLVLTLRTLRLGLIDASLSAFQSDESVESERERDQVGYALEYFERERSYALFIDADTPQLMEGDVSNRFAAVHSAEAVPDDEDEADGSAEKDNTPTHIRAWDCADLCSRYEHDEYAMVEIGQRQAVQQLRLLLQRTSPAVSALCISTVLHILERIVADPPELRYRSVNPAKVAKIDPGVPELLQHCGFVEEFMLEKNARFLCLAADYDLLLLSMIMRCLIEASRDRARRAAYEEGSRGRDVVVVD